MARSAALGSEHQVRLEQGLIRYRDTGPNDGPVLVFVAGLLFNGDLWRNVVPALAGGYRCVTPDLPLGAHQPALDTTDLGLPGLAQIVADLLDALDLREVTLVGNDSGGAIVQYVAAEHPQRVARIVLTPCDAFDNFPPPAFRYFKPLARTVGVPRLLLHSLRLRALQRSPIALGWFAKRPIDQSVIRSYLEAGLRDGGVRRNLRDFILAIDPRHTEHAARRLTGFEGPALVVWTEQDRLFPPEHGRRLADLLPYGRLVTVDDSYGCVPEDQPQRLATLIADFLAETAPEQAGHDVG